MPAQPIASRRDHLSHRAQVSRRAPRRILSGSQPASDPIAAAHLAHAYRNRIWWLNAEPRAGLFAWARVAAYRAV
jgi:hypothetical protein